MSERFDNKYVRLFMFTLQDEVWRFAQADRDLTIDGNVWQAAGIERDAIRRNTEQAQQNIKIRCAYVRDPAAPLSALPVTQDLGDIWTPYIPSQKVRVLCLRWNPATPGVPPSYEWSGEVASPRYTDVQLELNCTPGNARGNARNQGAKFQRGCFKAVYSTGIRGCNLDPAPLTVAATLSAVDGLTLTSAAFATAPHSLLHGWFFWTRSNGRRERRTIVAHSGSTIHLLYGGHELATGLEASVLPNCPGTWAACGARRADPENHYGGALFKPVQNPMDGVSMSWG